MNYVLMINNGYVRIGYKTIAGKDIAAMDIVADINDATIFNQRQIQTIGQDVYHYAKEVHNTLVRVIIVL